MDCNESEDTFFDPMAYLDDPFKENSPQPANPFGLLKFYGTKVKRLATELSSVQSYDLTSPVYIMKLAKARVREMISKNPDAFSIIANSLGDHHSVPQFSVFEDIEIAILLQAAAEKVASKEFKCARKLLRVCMVSSCRNGTPVQRIVYYLSESLQARIELETGINANNEGYAEPQDVIQTNYSLQTAVMEPPQEFQNIQEISQFAGIQSILEGVGSARRIHITDLGIKIGTHWTVLMQALSERKVSCVTHLRITAIGTSDNIMIETGKWLLSFAETMNLPFSFGIVLPDLKDIKDDFLDLESNETVAIYSSLSLYSLVEFPEQLESLLKVMRSLKPRVMVVHEIQASTNSPVFLERFDGELAYVSTLFDFFSVLGDDHPYRNMMEGTYFRTMMRNILLAEGTERVQRYEKIDFWRALFVICGFDETLLSCSALWQVELLQKTSNIAYRSCTLDLDGKSLILGWKGNPLVFISTWKLHKQISRNHSMTTLNPI